MFWNIEKWRTRNSQSFASITIYVFHSEGLFWDKLIHPCRKVSVDLETGIVTHMRLLFRPEWTPLNHILFLAFDTAVGELTNDSGGFCGPWEAFWVPRDHLTSGEG